MVFLAGYYQKKEKYCGEKIYPPKKNIFIAESRFLSL